MALEDGPVELPVVIRPIWSLSLLAIGNLIPTTVVTVWSSYIIFLSVPSSDRT